MRPIGPDLPGWRAVFDAISQSRSPFGPFLSAPALPEVPGDRQEQELQHDEEDEQGAPGEEPGLHFERFRQTRIADDPDHLVLPDRDGGKRTGIR
jgi:hypothetical protein